MQENLARGLSVVSRAVSNRSLPVLTNVLLKTEDGGLKLTATNLEIGITYWVPGKIETDGATSVPARLLTDLVNPLPGGEPIILQGYDGLAERVGQKVGTSSWRTVRQDDIDLFAKLTGDDSQMASLDFAYRREQLYFEILLDIRDAMERR